MSTELNWHEQVDLALLQVHVRQHHDLIRIDWPQILQQN